MTQLVRRPCLYCGHVHQRDTLCVKAPRTLGRRSFLGLTGAAFAAGWAAIKAPDYVMGVLRRGEVTVPISPVEPSEAVIAAVKDAEQVMLSNLSRYRVTMHDGTGYEFMGRPIAYAPSMAADGLMDATVSIQPTGPVTIISPAPQRWVEPNPEFEPARGVTLLRRGRQVRYAG